MTRERVYLFDTTLRDGAQTNGVDFTLADKLAIAGMLDKLGIDYVEGGYPGPIRSIPNCLRRIASSRPFTAFGMTRRPGRSASNDPGLVALLDATADAICFVAKSSDYQVRVALETTPEENIASIRDSVRAACAKGREVLLDCEHFFDGYKSNPQFALACARAAYDEGARWVVLCDTNGGALPHEVEAIVGEVVKAIPGDHVGIHAHNDTEQAVANSLAAVRAGARQVQGTLNGLGERCGNANLVSIIPTLKLKPEYADRFDISVSDEGLKTLTHVSHALDELLNRASDRHAPYVGECVRDQGWHSRIGHRQGSRDLRTCCAEAVGNRRKLLVSDQAGRSNVLAELDRIGIKVERDDARVVRLLDEVKEREAAGFAYEAADASFELLARRMLGTVPDYFGVETFDVRVEQRFSAKGERLTVTMAVVKVRVGDEHLISAAEGNGPVNALDLALRKALGKFQPYISGLELTDYRVRILNGGSGAVTRVLIESRDESGERWTTVGVSPNIIEASFQALMDSIVFKLVRSGAPA
jgi:2-isopropylmalate synthase